MSILTTISQDTQNKNTFKSSNGGYAESIDIVKVNKKMDENPSNFG